MKIVRSMASGCGYLIKGGKWTTEIESIMAAANEKSNSMHDEVGGRRFKGGLILLKTLESRRAVRRGEEASFGLSSDGLWRVVVRAWGRLPSCGG